GFTPIRADDEIRTRDPHLGKVMLYQLSHIRVPSFEDFTTIKDSENVCKLTRLRVDSPDLNPLGCVIETPL
ncbi:MAG: hypothetical protein RL016_303, partial [Actinomycetota bacterium]